MIGHDQPSEQLCLIAISAQHMLLIERRVSLRGMKTEEEGCSTRSLELLHVFVLESGMRPLKICGTDRQLYSVRANPTRELMSESHAQVAACEKVQRAWFLYGFKNLELYSCQLQVARNFYVTSTSLLYIEICNFPNNDTSVNTATQMGSSRQFDFR